MCLSEEVVVVGDEAVGEVEDHLEGEVGDAEDTSEEDGPVGEAITAHTIKVWRSLHTLLCTGYTAYHMIFYRIVMCPGCNYEFELPSRNVSAPVHVVAV
mmetsp:Transcript_23083/g.33808  ORF Transcript_23083/g.33808 Transcript_23083/m.33808 type:complete len:99 (+) Transcript_23083:552-848(+)